MAAEATALTPKTNPGQVFIAGRIDNARKHEGVWYTRLVLPAPDAYSAPAFVEVQSAAKLGDLESDWRGMCLVGGYRNDFDARDASGERSKVKSARNVLKVIE